MEFLLRPWQMEDAPAVARFANNKEIARNLRDVFPHPYTLADAQAYVESCVHTPEERQICRAIVAGGQAIGSIGLFVGEDVYGRSAELGYWLKDGETGKGYISEILPHIEKTFFSAGLHRLVIECETDNIASAAVAERNGYVFEGIAAGKVFGYGKYRDCKVYAKVLPD